MSRRAAATQEKDFRDEDEVEAERSMTFTLYGTEEIERFEKALALSKSPGEKTPNRSALIRVGVNNHVDSILDAAEAEGESP